MPDGREIIDATGLLGRLREPEAAMDAIGSTLSASSQRAFEERRFGEHRWPTRYPKQPAPFLNLAGALSDLNRGGFVKNRRFQREPVLRSTQTLFRSITHRVVGSNRVQVGVLGGPARSYAGLHQEGGESKQPVTETARKTLAKQLRRERGTKKQALRKLGFIFAVSSMETEVHRRPFVGVTPEAENEAREILVEFFTEGDT